MWLWFLHPDMIPELFDYKVLLCNGNFKTKQKQPAKRERKERQKEREREKERLILPFIS